MTHFPLPELQNALERLNPEQREAVEAIDGPVLVVAGPGTGKTQLLSLRVANILDKRDITANNILCLTYTNAGAQAMTKRLASLIGRAAYGVNIATFHSFATSIRARYPQYFERGAFDRAITSIAANKLIESYLRNVEYSDPLYQKPFEGNYGNQSDVFKLLGNFKKAGLEPNNLRRIIQQNLDTFTYLADKTELFQLLAADLPRGSTEKQQYLDNLQAYVGEVAGASPQALRESVVQTPGTYVPYIYYLNKQFADTVLYEQKDGGGAGKATGFLALRSALFKKDGGNYVLKDERGSKKLLSVVRLYEQYREELAGNALYDYDGMILDAILAIETHRELRQALQEQYLYVLVDEFQDTNGSQMRLLDLVCGGAQQGAQQGDQQGDRQGEQQGARPNILAVGDDDQAIMRFQGASVEHLNQFEQHYEGVKRIVLKTNYRSTPSLVALGQQVARQIENRSEASTTEKRLVAHKGEQEGAPKRFSAKKYASQDVQYFEVAKAIRARIDKGFIQNAAHPDEAIAVIAAKKARLAALIPYLKYFNIAYNYRVTTQVTKIESLQTLFALMHFVAAYSDLKTQAAETCLPQILAAPELGFASQDYFAFALEAKQSHKSWLVSLQESGDPRKRELASMLVKNAVDALTKSARYVIAELAKPLAHYYKQQSDPFALIEFNYGLRAILDFATAEAQAAKALGTLARPLRLTDIEPLLKDIDRFGIELNIDVPVAKPNAINLTSAHGSKGLEYDLVYLIDANKATWKNSRADILPLNKNMLFGSTRDDDDARRLLFVALTRARTELEISLGAGELVPELLGEIDVVEVPTTEADIQKQAESCWQDNYYPANQQLLEILRPSLVARNMSASLLNTFVTYQAADPTSSNFVLERLISLPGEPAAALEFGSCVHAFFEDYLNKVVPAGKMGATALTGEVGASTPTKRAGAAALVEKPVTAAVVEQAATVALAEETTMATLVASCKQRIASLDFEQSEIDPLLDRFDMIIQHFLPRFNTQLEQWCVGGNYELLSEQWVNCVLDDMANHNPANMPPVTLIGKCDLLVLDHAKKTMQIWDYKTGVPKKIDRTYKRQLQFYKLLAENSADYQGWTVLGGADLYVEPQKPNWILAEPEFITVTNDELEHLRLLIQAAWYRLQNCDFDVSAFKTSEQFAAVHAASVYKTGENQGQLKDPSKDALQDAFETWLIADYLNKP